jgi:hypothetical protein
VDQPRKRSIVRTRPRAGRIQVALGRLHSPLWQAPVRCNCRGSASRDWRVQSGSGVAAMERTLTTASSGQQMGQSVRVRGRVMAVRSSGRGRASQGYLKGLGCGRLGARVWRKEGSFEEGRYYQCCGLQKARGNESAADSGAHRAILLRGRAGRPRWPLWRACARRGYLPHKSQALRVTGFDSKTTPASLVPR